MASQPVQISLDAQLLRLIDRDPETRSQGRSAFIRSAARLYLKAKERRTIDSAIIEAYCGKEEELLREIENMIGNQTWPDGG